jgi:hypothetical protein
LENIDFTKYSYEELLGCQRNIDRYRYPDRAKKIDLLVHDKAKNLPPQKVTLANENGDIASVKTGRAPSLGQGLSELIGGTIFGIVWVSSTNSVETPQYFGLIGYFVIVSSIIGGSYHIYNALAKNRFSAQDIVSPEKEPDPLNKILGFESEVTGASYCTSCGNKNSGNFNYCPKCGEKLT